MEMQICSKKVLLTPMSPSNLGTASLGRFTPNPLVDGVIDSMGLLEVYTKYEPLDY